MTTLDWIIVIVLNGGVILFGFSAARGAKTSSDWFLGRRSLPWWAVGLSMFATNVDNADLVSLTGTTYVEGIHIIMVHTLGSLLGASFAAFYLVPAMARLGHYTNAEYLEARFGRTARGLSALIQIQYRSSMLGLMIWSLYLLLTGFMSVPVATAWWIIVLLVAMAAIYTSLGGLKSVVMTDALQGVIMLIAVVVIFTAVWNAFGSVSELSFVLSAQRLDESRTADSLLHMGQYHGDSGNTHPLVVAIGWIIIACGYWSVNHSQTMRLVGSRSVWDMKMAAIFGAVISMPIMVGSAMIGLLGRGLYPEFEAPDTLYPYLANEYLGVGFKGIVVAGIFAAAISTFDSMGSSLSALFTRDIYARFMVTDREDAHYVRVSRYATVAILGLGFAYLPFIGSKQTMLQAFLTLIPVFVTPLFTIYVIGIFTRAPKQCGVCGIAVGAIYGVVALLDREVYDVTALPEWLTGRWPALLWSMVATSLGATLATLRWGRIPVGDLGEVADTGWLRASRQQLEPLPEEPEHRWWPHWISPELLAGLLIASTCLILYFFFW